MPDSLTVERRFLVPAVLVQIQLGHFSLASMVELADTLDLGSSASAWGFKSLLRYHIGGISSVGRALALQAKCHRFDSDILHHFSGELLGRRTGTGL
jgi:hypothetical protein